MKYQVAFTNPSTRLLNRWREAEADTAEAAMIAALRTVRPGALRRYAKRHATLSAHVAWPKPRHANGRPAVTDGFLLSLSPIEGPPAGD